MRLCIVDDHEVVREGLQAVLERDPKIDVVGVAASGAEAMTCIKRTVPDVVVTDYRLPDTTGDELCRRIRTDYPSTHVIVLTTYLSEEMVRQSMAAGASAFVTKASGVDELRRELAALGDGASRGFTGGTSAVVKNLHAKGSGGERPITPQQERVLELAAEGLTYGQIAERLTISTSTVRFHIQGLKERLGLRTKTELIAYAIRHALIAPGVDAPR